MLKPWPMSRPRWSAEWRIRHVQAVGRDQDGEPDVAGARAEAEDEQPREGDQDHPGALRPAEHARRVAVDEPEHEHRDPDGPDDQGQDRESQDGVERVVLHGGLSS